MDNNVYLVWHDDTYPEDIYLISIHDTREKALQAIDDYKSEDGKVHVEYKIECWPINEKGVR
jgi:hypothetical protein